MLDRLEDNIARAQKEMTRHGIANRPHIKTHKIPAIARMQIEAGAIGITCQKLGEAEVFTDAGVTDDILLTYNIVGEAKTERLMAARGARSPLRSRRRQRGGAARPRLRLAAVMIVMCGLLDRMRRRLWPQRRADARGGARSCAGSPCNCRAFASRG